MLLANNEITRKDKNKVVQQKQLLITSEKKYFLQTLKNLSWNGK